MKRKDSNNDMLSMWCKKIDSAGQAYCVYSNSVLKYRGECFEAFSNHAKIAIHIRNSKRAKEVVSLNQFISKSNEGNLGHSV